MSFKSSQSSTGFNAARAGSTMLSPPKSSSSGSGAGSPKGTASGIRPISTLNPYQRNWTIKARVTAKSEVRTWSKPGGSAGKLMSVDLMDADGGQIRATMFNQTVDKYGAVFEEKKVYIISKGSLKTANTRFNKLPHEYEISLGDESDIIPVEDTHDIKQQSYAFVRFADLEQVQKDSFIDVLGIVQTVGPAGQITTKAQGKQLNKRNVTLVDSSQKSVELTLWGEQADQYDEHKLANNPVVAIKSVRVSDYSNRTLSTSFQSRILLNPTDTPEAVALRQWFDSEGKDTKFETMSHRDNSSGNSGGGNSSDPKFRKTFSQIKDEHLGRASRAGGDSKGDYFTVRGTVVYYNVNPQKPPWYLACGLPTAADPKKMCQKKVTNDMGSTGSFRCESCNKSVPNPEPRYLLSVLACDHTGGYWLTAFNEQAEKLVGDRASEVKRVLDTAGPDAFKQMFSRSNFTQCVFRVRAQEDNGPPNSSGGGGGDGSETRVRCQVVSVEEVKYKTESQMLVDNLERVLGTL